MNEIDIMDILLILFSTQIISTYQRSFRTKYRSCNIGKIVSWCFYIIAQYIAILTNAGNPLLILIINIILVFLISLFSFDIDKKMALFQSGILYVFWMLIELVTNYVLAYIQIADSAYGFFVGSAISKIIMYIVANILNHVRKTSIYGNMPLHYWIRLFLIPLSTIYIIHNTYCLTYDSYNQRNIFFLITTILMLLVNYVTFDVYDRLGNHLEAEQKNLAYTQQIALCNKQAAERENAYKETRRIRHDLNEYLVDLSTTLQIGTVQDVEKKIAYMLNQNQIYRSEISRSGNIVIDSLINYKYSLSQNNSINMKCYVFVPELLMYDGADLCIILGNLIDNAIEAVKQLDSQKRNIEISVTQVKGSLSIVIQNQYIGIITKNSKGYILTNKKDTIDHGIGLNSVQKAVDKYNGELMIDTENEIFKVTVLLYPPEKLHADS